MTTTASICGEPLHGLMHICAFVDSRDQQYEILRPFLRQGLECDDCLLTVVSPENHADHVVRLRAAGIDAGALAPAGQLMLHTFEDTYLKDGFFLCRPHAWPAGRRASRRAQRRLSRVARLRRFSGRVITDILSTHPKVIMGGKIYENPYYIHPDVFLKHLATRKQVHACQFHAVARLHGDLSPVGELIGL